MRNAFQATTGASKMVKSKSMEVMKAVQEDLGEVRIRVFHKNMFEKKNNRHPPRISLGVSLKRRSEDCTHLSQESPILESPTHLLAGWTKERFKGDLQTLSHNRGSGQLRYPVCKHKGVRERGQASTCVRVTMCTMLVPSSAVTSRLPIST